jgi:hypothetical protein
MVTKIIWNEAASNTFDDTQLIWLTISLCNLPKTLQQLFTKR